MNQKILFFFNTLLFFLLTTICKGQITITGPKCVVPNTEYQYNIQGRWKRSDKAQICVKGGVIAGSFSTCVTDSVFSFVRIIWNKGAINGSIMLTALSGNATQAVTVTTPLSGGVIADSSVKQDIAYKTLPKSIQCTAPTGGACKPSYALQWQQSSDGSTWKDMPGKTSTILTFSVPLTQTTYYRRRTKDVSSNVIDYSNAAVVYVGIDMTGHQ